VQTLAASYSLQKENARNLLQPTNSVRLQNISRNEKIPDSKSNLIHHERRCAEQGDGLKLTKIPA
jgi:hypothetical protein